jgi:hypothetical protein
MTSIQKLPMLFLFALFFCTASYAQTAAGEDVEGNIFIQQVDGTARIVQRLSWQKDENASQYGLVVERQEGNRFREVFKQTTRNAYGEVSLGPGRYRYRVSFYNLLNQIEYSTNWASFNIILALQPKITGVSTDKFFLDEDAKWEILLQGENLLDEAAVYLEPLLIGSGKIIKPRSYTPISKGEQALLVFANTDLAVGSYRIVIRNPGKLEDSFSPFKIAMGPPLDVLFSASYTPLISLQGYLFDEAFDDFTPKAFQARLGFIPFKRPWGYLGLEGEFFWDYLLANKRNAEISAHLLGYTVNVFYKKWLPNRVMALNIRAGGGIYSLLDFSFDFGAVKSDPVTTWFPSVNAGASFQWYPVKHFYLELGMDYLYLFTVDTPRLGSLKPGIGAGVQF